MIMVNVVKWVDEVIPDVPYAIAEDFMKKLFDEYNIILSMSMVMIRALFPIAPMRTPLLRKLGDINKLNVPKEFLALTLLVVCFFVLERGSLVEAQIILFYKDNSVMVIAKSLKMVDLAVELVSLIFYQHPTGLFNSPMEKGLDQKPA